MDSRIESELKLKVEKALEKNAGMLTTLKNIFKTKTFDYSKNPFIMGAVVPAGIGLASYGAGALIDNISKKLDSENVRNRIGAVTQEILDEPEFAKNRDAVIDRIGEIASISPRVAQSPVMLKPYLRETVKKKLTTNNIESLLENEIRTIKKVPKFESSALAKTLKENYVGKTLAPILKEEMPKLHDQAIETMNRPLPSQPNFTGFSYTNTMLRPALDEYVKKHKELPEQLRGVNPKTPGGQTLIYETVSKSQSLQEELTPYLRKAMEKMTKTSAISVQTSSPLMKAMKGGLTALLAGAGFRVAAEGAKLVQTRKENEELNKAWGSVQKKLKDFSKADGITTKEYDKPSDMNKAKTVYKSLSNFAPSIAKDPVLGASVVNRVLENEGSLEVSTIKTLVDIQKGMNQNIDYRSPFAKSPFSTGVAAAGGKEMLSKAVKEIADNY